MNEYRTGIPEERRLEWQAEHRFLVRKRQEDARRIKELEEILKTFWPEGK